MPAPWIDYGVVKEQADFARILSGYGITLKGQGSQHLVVCPFHKEKVGSLSVNLNLKVFHCFGCGATYAGRWASDDVPPRVPKYLLPRGFKKSEVLFNLHRVASAEHVMLVEGYWAVFRLHALGIPAVALMGRTLSGAQEELLACSGARFRERPCIR